MASVSRSGWVVVVDPERRFPIRARMTVNRGVPVPGERMNVEYPVFIRFDGREVIQMRVRSILVDRVDFFTGRGVMIYTGEQNDGRTEQIDRELHSGSVGQ